MPSSGGSGACLANISALRIPGVGRTARLAILRAAAGTFTTTNVYNQQCAFVIDRSLMAEGSSMQKRMHEEMGTHCGITGGEYMTQEITTRGKEGARTGMRDN